MCKIIFLLVSHLKAPPMERWPSSRSAKPFCCHNTFQATAFQLSKPLSTQFVCLIRKQEIKHCINLQLIIAMQGVMSAFFFHNLIADHLTSLFDSFLAQNTHLTPFKRNKKEFFVIFKAKRNWSLQQQGCQSHYRNLCFIKINKTSV